MSTMPSEEKMALLRRVKAVTIHTAENIDHLHYFLGITLPEARVAAFLASGFSQQQIARENCLTEGTVRTYTKRIMQSLEVHHQHEIVQVVLHLLYLIKGIMISTPGTAAGRPWPLQSPRTLERKTPVRAAMYASRPVVVRRRRPAPA